MAEQLNISPYKDWLGEEGPYYIFGPCSAESISQLETTAKEIHQNFKNILFRAGVWKPRTRPNSFEGIGSEALDWMQEIKTNYGFKITTEVADANHVEECLKAGVDVLWIGARTTANPFSIQAVADALQGVDIPVLVKNPIHADLSLWVGGLERINRAGIHQLGAIHRGFFMSDNSPYRNSPNWNLPIQLKAMYPDLPIICDASHIAGKPELIAHVAQKAIDLDMDGLMVETHMNPSAALSDKEQQVSPQFLHELIAGLTPKTRSSADKEYKSQLELLRDQIDQVDNEWIEWMAKRMALAKKIGEYKAKNNVTVLQVNRWQSILDRNIKAGMSMGLSEKFLKELLNSIHDESIRKQTDNLE